MLQPGNEAKVPDMASVEVAVQSREACLSSVCASGGQDSRSLNKLPPH